MLTSETNTEHKKKPAEKQQKPDHQTQTHGTQLQTICIVSESITIVIRTKECNYSRLGVPSAAALAQLQKRPLRGHHQDVGREHQHEGTANRQSHGPLKIQLLKWIPGFLATIRIPEHQNIPMPTDKPQHNVKRRFRIISAQQKEAIRQEVLARLKADPPPYLSDLKNHLVTKYKIAAQTAYCWLRQWSIG